MGGLTRCDPRVSAAQVENSNPEVLAYGDGTGRFMREDDPLAVELRGGLLMDHMVRQ
jgi:hypothetical protein